MSTAIQGRGRSHEGVPGDDGGRTRCAAARNARQGFQRGAMSPDAYERFVALPGRILLDTCILNKVFEYGEYIFDGAPPGGVAEEAVDPDLRALRLAFMVNQRASFQFLVSPLTVAEIANTQAFGARDRLLGWVLEVLDHWLVMLDEIGDRASEGGTVRHRFKLKADLQAFEARLMEIPDFRRDPFDRLLLVQYRMGNCDAFLTTDGNTIWRHRERLVAEGVTVLRPAEFWERLSPWAAIWC